MISTIHHSINPAIYSMVADEIIEPTFTTPYVKYDKRSNALTIKGASTRENLGQFYGQVLGDFKYNLKTKRIGSLQLQLTKFGPSTLKVLFSLFRFIAKEQKLGAKVDIHWNILGANLEMIEQAKDFADLYDLRIRIR